MSDDSISSTANNSYIPIAAALLRGLMQIASGVGFTWAATVSGDQITMAATAAVMLGTLIWSAWQKVMQVRAARRSEVSAAVASASATDIAGRPTPVTVTVTPEGMPNVATMVSEAEQRAAPSVPFGTQPSPAPQAAA